MAAELADRFFCIMPTSTVYCAGQTYADKADEVRQIKEFLRGQGVERVEMVVAAGKALSYGNIRRQMADSLEDKPFPPLSKELQKRCFLNSAAAEDHFKYRAAVMQAYPAGNFPVFDGYNHMQYQIRDPKGLRGHDGAAVPSERIIMAQAFQPVPFSRSLAVPRGEICLSA